MKLRPYQDEFLQALRIAVREGHTRICGVSPTGSGKTVMMAALVDSILAKKGTVMICVHLDALVGQTVDKLRKFGIEGAIGFIKAKYPEDRTASIQVASVQTMARRQWWKGLQPTVVLWDEAHQSSFSTIGRKTITEIFPGAIHLGLTATPIRTKRTEGMRDLYQTLVQGLLPRDLQSMGNLAQMRYFSVDDHLDLRGVKVKGGDFDQEELATRVNNPEMINDALFHWERLSSRQRTLVFCVDRKHAYAVLSAFLEKGISAAIVTGETPKKERDTLYQNFDNGSITVLVSINVISIGFDSPRAAVGLMLRPTKSLALHLQQVGRIMRIHPEKDHGIIIDQAGNCLRHGIPEDLQPWTLDEGQPAGEPPVKKCPNCQEIIPASANPCPACGHIFPPKEMNRTDAKPKALKEIKSVLSESEKERRDWYRKRRKAAWRKGIAPGVAVVEFKERYGEKSWPRTTWNQDAIFDGQATEEDRQKFWTWLCFKGRDRDPEWAIKQWQAEFGKHTPLPNTYAKP